MKRMRVAHIITKLSLGGAQENTIYTYFHHDRQRYEVFLLTGTDSRYGGEGFAEKMAREENFRFIRDLSNSFNLFNDIRAVLEICHFLKKDGIDIVHTHSSKAGVLGRLAAKAAGVCVIVHTVHGWSFHERMSKNKKRFYVLLERLSAMLCDKMVAVTVKDIEKGLREGIGSRDKYTVIRSGIDFEKFNRFDRERIESMKAFYGGKKIVGTVGRISEQKNLCDFVRISKKLAAKRNDLHFIIIGDGPDRDKIMDLIKLYGLEGRIELMGSRQDIQDLMRMFHVLVLTSLWEGLPRVIPEAMYCGIPVVANNVDGVAEIIENGVNGFVTTPGDIDAACRWIELLLDDDALRYRITENAYRTVYPEFDACLMVQKIELLYENILREKKPGRYDCLRGILHLL